MSAVTSPASSATSPPLTGASARRVDLPSLTGIRGAGAAYVFFAHVALAGIYANEQLTFVLQAVGVTLGHSMVSLFFALSGFVLTWTMRDGDKPLPFMRRRVAKVFPNHLVTATAGLLLMFAFSNFSGWGAVLPSFFLIHAWFPDIPVVLGTNGPNWSLSAEIFYYALFPFLLGGILRLPLDRLWFLVKIAAAIAFLVPAISLLLPEGKVMYDIVPTNRFWFTNFLPSSRIIEFIIGIMVARMVIEGRWTVVPTRKVLGAIFIAWVIAAAGSPYLWVAPYMIPIALVLGNAASRDIAAAAGEPTAPRRLAHPRWVFLGQVSFGFYLTHWLVLEYGHRLFDKVAWSVIPATAFCLAALLVSFATGYLLYRFVEIPAYRRWANPKRKPKTAVATA